MSNRDQTGLAMYVERARKVLQHEQRLHHQDQAIKPGGLEAFVTRWAEEICAICQSAGMDVRPIYHFVEYLEGYRKQNPIERAANIRAALAILNDLAGQEGSARTTPPESAPASFQSKKVTSQVAASTKSTSSPASPPPSTKLASAATPASKTASSNGMSRTEQHASEPASNRIHLEAGMSQGHTALTLLSADITAIPGVGTSVGAKLHRLGIRTVRDLLFYFPRDHRAYSQLTKIENIPFNEVTTTMGLIWEVTTKHISGGRTRTIATISDATGKLYASWFNQPYLQKQLKKDSQLVVTGVKQRFGNKVEFAVRSHELAEQGDLLNTGRLVPIYPLTEGLHEKALRRFTKWAVDRYAAMVPEHLPRSVIAEGNLLPLPEAIKQIHYPESEEMRLAARRRLAFDELFLIQLGMQERRTRWQREAPQGNAFHIDLAKIFLEADQLPAIPSEAPAQVADDESVLNSTLWSTIATDQPFEATLPFRFTDAQRRVIQEIFGDLAKSRPMSRLLQGDVGAGKTAVAAATLLLAALNGFQGAIMAPTELLAEQHARSISAMLAPFGIKTVLLTGSLRPRERTMGRNALESGEALVAVGTHALIQEDVNFRRLGLVIVDEQHRFGVE